jgi:hypothetical protein
MTHWCVKGCLNSRYLRPLSRPQWRQCPTASFAFLARSRTEEAVGHRRHRGRENGCKKCECRRYFNETIIIFLHHSSVTLRKLCRCKWIFNGQYNLSDSFCIFENKTLDLDDVFRYWWRTRERDKAEKERNIDIPTIVYNGFMVLMILWTPITTACQHISGMSS